MLFENCVTFKPHQRLKIHCPNFSIKVVNWSWSFLRDDQLIEELFPLKKHFLLPLKI